MAAADKIRIAGAYLAAVLVTATLATVLATQFVLARLAALGAEPGWALRAETTLHDLAGMGPNYAALIAVGFAIALPVAGRLARVRPVARAALFTLAGAAAMAAILLAMRGAFGIMPIAGARGSAGFAAQLLAGAAGGWFFTMLRSGRRR